MNHELRTELLAMRDADQAARRAWVERTKSSIKEGGDGAALKELDRRHAVHLAEIVESHGWPGSSVVGVDGASAAWLLLQHADHATRRSLLPLMEAAVALGEASAGEFALLTDRTLRGEGKPQIYGSQFVTIDGVHYLEPLADREGVDERRRAVGLGTLEENRRGIEEMYGGTATLEERDVRRMREET